MTKLHSTALTAALAIVVLLPLTPSIVNASAEPGAIVRNVFGPQAGGRANRCRGACGGDCPQTCEASVSYECLDGARLRRVATYDCGTHQGCRVHDDCLDACLEGGDQVGSCSTQCDAEIMDRFGIGSAGAWLLGNGPYDGRVRFEYTRDGPGALEPAYRCPDGATRQCAGDVGCVAGGTRVEPVFDSYPGAGADAMQVAGFRAGPACGDRVCDQSAEIRITGADSCPGGSCSRFGMEFDYSNADPSAPLACSTSTSGGDGDFVGDLLKQGADAMESRGTAPDPNSEDGMEALMGVFQKLLSSADSPEDVNVSIAPLGPDGKPIESPRVGSQPRDGPPPIPDRVDLPAASGHLFVPMYQLAGGMEAGQIKERRVRCTHKGAPVLDTTFRLVSAGDPPAQSPAASGGAGCCSCALVAGTAVTDPRLPCRFDYPEHWQATIGDDGALLSAVVGPAPASCTTNCPNGTPGMSVSYGTTYDSNADTMLAIWPMAMPVVGSGRCGAGTVQFFSPPGADPDGFLGGVKFYVEIGGAKYGGAAQFTCGEPGGWLRLRDMFISSFGDNPGATFPNR